MATELASTSAQFEVLLTGSSTAAVLFNGHQVQNVKSVFVTTDVDSDDVVRSSITIDLVGEPVLTRVAPQA